MSPDSITGNIEELRLLVEKVRVRYAVDDVLMRGLPGGNLEFHCWRDERLAHMVWQVDRAVAYMPGDRIVVPETWWDAFKERWFPVWARGRWPVRRKTYEARAYVPTLELPRGPDSRHIDFARWTRVEPAPTP